MVVSFELLIIQNAWCPSSKNETFTQYRIIDLPFSPQVISLTFSPTWSCVSLPRPTTSSAWAKHTHIWLIWDWTFTNLYVLTLMSFRLAGLKETKMFLPHPRVKVSIVGSLRDREVACSASDRQGSNFESCVWRTMSSQSSHHPQEVLLAQFSQYVHKGGLKPNLFHLFLRSFHIAVAYPANKID